MQSSHWPFPSKPHPASLGSGLMGNHGYRPHTSPPFFFPRERNWSEGEKKRGGERRGCPYWYLLALVSLMLIGSLHLHKAVHYDARTGPPSLSGSTAQLERNEPGSYTVCCFCFLFLHCRGSETLLHLPHKREDWESFCLLRCCS